MNHICKISRSLVLGFRKDCPKIDMSVERIQAKNNIGEELLESIKTELNAIRNEIVAKEKSKLLLENAKLSRKIERAKNYLILLELEHGKLQIPIPGARRSFCTETKTVVDSSPATTDTPTTENKPLKQKKQKAEKPVSEKTLKQAAAISEAPIDVGRLDFRVGKIVEVNKHPDADTLYLEKIDCGEPQPRTVVSGLVKYVPIEEMHNRMVVVLCNLKPAKMRGIVSEAMVMCASTPEKVEILSPPIGAVPGDLVHCTGYERQPDAQLNPKKKVFETCAPDLLTNENLVACYKGNPLHVPDKGNVTSQSLKNVNVK